MALDYPFLPLLIILSISLQLSSGLVTNWSASSFALATFLSDNNNTAVAPWVWDPDGLISLSALSEMDRQFKSLVSVQRSFRPSSSPINWGVCAYGDRLALAILNQMDVPPNVTAAEYAAEFVDFLYHSWTVAKWPDLNPKTNCNNTAMFLYAQTYNLLVFAGMAKLQTSYTYDLINQTLMALANNTPPNTAITDAALVSFATLIARSIYPWIFPWWGALLVFLLMIIVSSLAWLFIHYLEIVWVRRQKARAKKTENLKSESEDDIHLGNLHVTDAAALSEAGAKSIGGIHLSRTGDASSKSVGFGEGHAALASSTNPAVERIVDESESVAKRVVAGSNAVNNENANEDEPITCARAMRKVLACVISYFLKLKGKSLGKRIPETDPLGIAVAVVGSFLAASFLAIIQQYAGVTEIIPPFGATIIILFCMPDSPAGRPRVALQGCLIGALCGVTVQIMLYQYDILWLRAGLSLGLTVFMQFVTRCIHPPGGAVCLVPVITPFFVEYGYWFLLIPTTTGALLLILTNIAVTNFNPKKMYPIYWL